MKYIKLNSFITDLYIPIGNYRNILIALMHSGIATIKDLCLRKEEDILKIRGIKEQSLEAINKSLGESHLRVGMSEDEIDYYNLHCWM